MRVCMFDRAVAALLPVAVAVAGARAAGSSPGRNASSRASMTPYCSAASAISGLTVEPGGYTPRSARSSSGMSMSSASAAYSGTREAAREAVRVEGRACSRTRARRRCADRSPRRRRAARRAPLRRPAARARRSSGRGRCRPASAPCARGPLPGADALDAAALRVHEQLLVARRAVQLVLVGALDAESCRSATCRRSSRRSMRALVLLADRCRRSRARARRSPPIRIVARQARPRRRRPGSPWRLHGEAREFLVAELQPDRHRVEAAPRHRSAPASRSTSSAASRPMRRPAAAASSSRSGVCSRDQFELVGRAVVREHHAVAIEISPRCGGSGSMRTRLPCESSLK